MNIFRKINIFSNRKQFIYMYLFYKKIFFYGFEINTTVRIPRHIKQFLYSTLAENNKKGIEKKKLIFGNRFIFF